MNESFLTRRVVHWLGKQNLFFWKTSDRFTSGIPDIIICYHGKFIAIELKRKTGRVSKLQNAILDKINKAGGKAFVCRTLDEVKYILSQY